ALGQADADRGLDVEQAEELLLILETRTRRVPEAHAHAAIARLEPLLHRHPGRVGEAPHLAQALVEELRERLRALDRERLDDVGVEEAALRFPSLRELAHALAARDREERD